jgi:hypothetical protein
LKPVRVLAALGALLFVYLAVIPAAVVGATLDPSCAGSSCSYSAPVTVYLVFGFSLCAITLGASSVSLAAYAIRPSQVNGRHVRRSLQASVAVVGLLLLSELALPHPVVALSIVAVCVPIALLGAANRTRHSGARTRAPG